MAVYNANGIRLNNVYSPNGAALIQAYDVAGNELISSGGDEWVKTILAYDTNFLINQAWIDAATVQRDAILALYQQSNDAIPFFIMTDGHGRYNEGNKGCHNLSEPVMQYIANIQLGDYQSYYANGNNPANHARTSEGISNYISVMGNHEFLNNNSDDALLADLPTLVASYTPAGAVLGSATYGYYKLLDSKYNVKYLVGQPHIPTENSNGFISKYTSDQWEWFIDELESNDGYDVVVLNHEPFEGIYTKRSDDSLINYTGGNYNLSPVLADRKAKQSGSITDADGNTHTYDFTSCTSDLLCVLHGHVHKELYFDKTQFGYPAYTGKDFTGSCESAYGLIDRANGKLYIYSFSRSGANEALALDL